MCLKEENEGEGEDEGDIGTCLGFRGIFSEEVEEKG